MFIIVCFVGPFDKLKDEIHSIHEQLSHAESEMAKNIDLSKKPLTLYLMELQFVDENDQLPSYIPDTVLIEHYVKVRVIFRR